MNNEKWKKAILNIINVLENKINNKDELDKIYSQITKAITNEMELYLKFKECSRKCKQKFRQSKPYWSENLALLWKDMNEKEITTIVQNRLYQGKDTFVAFIDFTKAFDSVDRNLLLFKLLDYNINGNIYFAIKKLYSETHNCIRVNSMYTRWFPSLYGVRQGDCLSPTLFSIFLNDLTLMINEANLGISISGRNIGILLYADDIVLLAKNELNLQRQLDILNTWCNKWRLTVNLTKSEIIHFRKTRKKQTKYMFKFGNNSLAMVSKYKYLGIILDEHLTYKECATTLADSAGRALGSVISKFYSFKNIGYSTFSKLYDTTVWPILDYCSSIWSFKNIIMLPKYKTELLGTFWESIRMHLPGRNRLDITRI